MLFRSEKGIVFATGRHVNYFSVAEHAMAILLMLVRDLRTADEEAHKGLYRECKARAPRPSITTNGTAAGLVRATLPSTPAADFNNGMGRETAVAGFMCGAYGFASTNNLSIFKLADSSYPGGNGYVINCQVYYRLS